MAEEGACPEILLCVMLIDCRGRWRRAADKIVIFTRLISIAAGGVTSLSHVARQYGRLPEVARP